MYTNVKNSIKKFLSFLLIFGLIMQIFPIQNFSFAENESITNTSSTAENTETNS
jgi:hypothetical protein